MRSRCRSNSGMACQQPEPLPWRIAFASGPNVLSLHLWELLFPKTDALSTFDVPLLQSQVDPAIRIMRRLCGSQLFFHPAHSSTKVVPAGTAFWLWRFNVMAFSFQRSSPLGVQSARRRLAFRSCPSASHVIPHGKTGALGPRLSCQRKNLSSYPSSLCLRCGPWAGCPWQQT